MQDSRSAAEVANPNVNAECRADVPMHPWQGMQSRLTFEEILHTVI